MIKKRNSSTKTRNSDTNTHCSVFLFRCGKTEQYCKKTNSGTKTSISGTKHTVPFLLRFRKKRNSSEKHTKTMVQKHQPVVQNTLFHFCTVVSCEKNGTVVQKKNPEQWYKNTLFRFCFGVPYEKKNRTYLAYLGFNLKDPKLAFPLYICINSR